MTSNTQLPQAETPNRKKRFLRLSIAWKAGVAVIVIAAIVWFMMPGQQSVSTAVTFTARRGDLPITVTQGGSIEAEESQTIKNEVKGQTKIIAIVEEGYLVTEKDVAEGKVLVELDDNDLQERRTQQEIEYQTSRAQYTEASEQYEIQIKQNESDVTTAELNVKFARMDFEKYLGQAVATEILESLDLLELPPIEETSLAPDPPILSEEDRLALEAELGDEANATEELDDNPGPGDAPRRGPNPGNGQAPQRPEGRRPPSDAPADGEQVADRPLDGPDHSPSLDSPEDVEPAGDVEVGDDATDPMLDMASTVTVPARTVDFTAYADPERLGDGEAQERLRKLQADRLLAEEELQLNEKNLEGTRRLRERDFVTQQELETDEMKVRRSANTAEASRIAEELFIKYEFPKEAEKLLSDYQEAIRRLVRVRKEAVSNLAQAEARMKSAEAKYLLQAARRQELIEQLEKCTIRAERPGLVVYAGSNDPWRRQEPIEEGATVYERQEIITIPDMTKMAAAIKIHESAIQRVERGMQARIRVESRPDIELQGTVTRIAVLPDSGQRWMNPDLKLYPANVRIDGVHEWLKPGMTAEVEILVDELKDVVYVPIQAVSPYGGQRVCYVVNALGQPERRVVETGEFNNEYIEIKSGLEAGERVLLRAPQDEKGKPTPDGAPQDGMPRQPREPAPQVAST